MRIRTVTYANFRRNIPFWVGRQAKGEEINLTQMGKVVGTLYGEPTPAEPEDGLSSLKRHNRPLWSVSARG
jgi:antitoxin (DNA-binding transcriptional repressor) of toxin-antitoxin stability system